MAEKQKEPSKLSEAIKTSESELVKRSEQFTEMQKTALNLYARQTTAAIDCCRTLFPLIPSSFFDIAQSNVVGFVRMQMRMLDLISSQNRTYLKEIDDTIQRAA